MHRASAMGESVEAVECSMGGCVWASWGYSQARCSLGFVGGLLDGVHTAVSRNPSLWCLVRALLCLPRDAARSVFWMGRERSGWCPIQLGQPGVHSHALTFLCEQLRVTRALLAELPWWGVKLFCLTFFRASNLRFYFAPTVCKNFSTGLSDFHEGTLFCVWLSKPESARGKMAENSCSVILMASLSWHESLKTPVAFLWLWLVWSNSHESSGEQCLDFVLSCFYWYLNQMNHLCVLFGDMAPQSFSLSLSLEHWKPRSPPYRKIMGVCSLRQALFSRLKPQRVC